MHSCLVRASCFYYVQLCCNWLVVYSWVQVGCQVSTWNLVTNGIDKAVNHIYIYIYIHDSQCLLVWRKGTDHIVVVTAVLVS